MSRALIHGVTYFKNKRMTEGALRNTHLEIREVRNGMSDLMKRRAHACSELIKWAESLNDSSVLQLISSLGDVEVRMNALSKEYTAEYKEFTEVFRQILFEKQELNAVKGELKKARKKLETCKREVRKHEVGSTMASSKDADKKRRQFEESRTQLQAAENEEKELWDKMTSKALAVQRQLHGRLRVAYYKLRCASMNYLHGCADLEEEALRTIAVFPDVKSFDAATGEYVFAPYAHPIGPTDPIWHHGERLAQLLDLQREGTAARMDHEGQARKSMVDQLTKDLMEREASVTAELKRAQALINSEQTSTARREQVTASLLHAQVGIADSSAIEEEGFTEFILRHGAMAQRAVEDLIVALSREITDEADFVAKAAALSMTLNATLLSSVGYARFSQAENSLDLMPLATAVASASRDFIAHAVAQAPSVALFPPMTFQSHLLSGNATLVPASLQQLAEASTSTQARLNSIVSERDSPPPDKKKEKKKKGKKNSTAPATAPASQGGSPRSSRSFLPSRPAPLPPIAGKMATPKSPMYLPGMAEPTKTEPTKAELAMDPRRMSVNSLDMFPETTFGESTDSMLFPAPPPAWFPPTTAAAPAMPHELNAVGTTLKQALKSLCNFVQSISSRDSELRGAAKIAATEIERKAYTAQQMLADSVARLERLRESSSTGASGRLLETNQAVLDCAMAMLRAVSDLITNAQRMQADLSRREGGSKLSAEEFAAKHKKWLEHFSVTATEVIDATPMLLEAVVQVIQTRTKHEEVDVASHSITGSTAQLVASSRTKALPSGCNSGEMLVSSGAKIMNASQALVAAARESYNLKLAGVLMEDYGTLTEHQAKRLMLATQVEVLKLDTQLQREREKLGKLRTMFASEEKEKTQTLRN